MKVIRASVLGYCMGVRRAVDIAYRESRAAAEGLSSGGVPRRVCTLGPLIHNPQVLEDLRSRGARVLDEASLPEDLENHVILIRAHGVRPQAEEALIARGVRIVDATCPKVKANQMKARQLSREGYQIFLAGERRHSEIIGIQGYAPSCIIVADPGEAEQAAAQLCAGWEPAKNAFSSGKGTAKIALIGQTTLSAEEYRAIGEGIGKYFPQVERINTICQATAERQEALAALCGQVAAVVVAGGRESANTRRLRDIAEGRGKAVWLAESPEDIPPEIRAYQLIGLSAGASTPGWIIDALEERLLRMA